MSWVLASILMFFSSIVFYLTVKKLQIIGIDKRTISFVNNIFAAGMFGLIALRDNQSLLMSVYALGMIIVLRVLFNYLGAMAGYESMSLAPNAGYSLVIQKSYAVYTLFATVILFGSEISLYRFFIAGLVLALAGYIGFSKGKNVVETNSKWAIYALVAMFSYGTIALSGKYIFNLGVAPAPMLFWSSIFTALLAILDMRRLSIKLEKQGSSTILYMIILGLSVTGFNYFKLLAELAAPNLGYVSAINAASNAVYAVLVAIIFKDSLSKSKFIAILAMTVGLIMLLFS